MKLKNNTDISQELLETVERYVNKSMSFEELKRFEDKLQESDFKDLVEDVKIMLLGIESQSLKEQLEDFHKEIPELQVEKKSRNVRFLHFTKIAAAAVILITVGNFWYSNQNSNGKIYAKHFTPDPGLPTTMSVTTNFQFNDAMVNYKRGDYSVAIKKWAELQKDKPNNDTLNYFIGVAHLANKNEVSAIQFLNNVTQNSTSNFNNDAYYYLGLAYLKANNLELAKKNLNFSTIDISKDILSELE